jgi:hypothetical protein
VGGTETIQKKLEDATMSTRQAALTLVVAFSKNGMFFIGTFFFIPASAMPLIEQVRASIIRKENVVKRITSLLMNPDADVQDHALKAVYAVSTTGMSWRLAGMFCGATQSLPAKAREWTKSTGEIIKNIIPLLDRGFSTCQLAFDTIVSFLPEGMIHHPISSQIEFLVKIV